MADFKSLQVSNALARITQQLKPQVTYGSLGTSVYGTNTNTPNATTADELAIQQGQQYYNSIYGKTASDYAQDAGVALAKGIVSVPQAAAGIVDLADAGGQFITGQDVQGGRFTKALDEAGIRFKDTQDIMSGWYSEGTQKQFQGLSALPGTSTSKSLGDNLSAIGDTAAYVAQNPSIALNTIIESIPAIAAGGLVGRGAAAASKTLQGVAGAIGEGTTMAGQAQANMQRNAEGYTTGEQALGALGIGILGGVVGQLGARVAGHSGAADINSVVAGQTSRAANQGIKSLSVGTATEAAEEAAQSALENVITNVTSNKDALSGFNQDVVLGTFAGAGMGAGINSHNSITTAALEAVQNAANKQIERAKEKISRETPEQTDTPTEAFTDPSSPSYNPSAALVREAQNVIKAKTPEDQLDARNKFNAVLTDQENYLNGLIETKNAVDNIDNLRASIVNAEAAVTQFSETNPDRAKQIQNIADSLKEQVAVAEKFVGNEQTLNDHIADVQAKVAQARDMHSKFESRINVATANDETLDNQIFGAPYSFSAEQIMKAVDDPKVPESSKPALRALADAVVAQNAVKDINTVNQQIVGKQYDASYRSTPQYLAQFTKAIKTGNTAQQVNLMREIGAFEQSHVQKATVVQQGLALASQGQPVQIIRTEQGNWELNQGEWLSSSAAEKNGAITIASPKQIEAVTKTNEYIQAEAKAITATRAAMEQLNILNNPKPVSNTPSFQAAMDELNSLERDSYDFQPNRRIEDPRNNETRPSTTTALPESGTTQTEVQPTKGAIPSTGNTKQSNAKDKVILTGKSPYLAKDQAKADQATKFIGRGSAKSSTVQYAKDFGDKANTGLYTATDKVFVSAEGNRANRVAPDFDELGKAMKAGSTIITDNRANRERAYNVGERQVAEYLISNGYEETGSGIWTPKEVAQAERVASRSVSEDVATEVQASTKTDSKTTKQQAMEILESKYSEDTHTVYQKDDGSWAVRKRDLQAELDAMGVGLDNNVQAFDEVTVDEDGEASAIVTQKDADEKVSEVSARDAERVKPINERNLIIDGFNRKQVPLVAVPNLHQYLDNPKRIKAVITKLTKVQPEQKHVDNVEQFMRFRDAFAQRINGSVKVRRVTNPDHAKFNWQDYLQFLVKDDGTFDEATITALAATAYTWVAENGEVTTKSEKDVAKLLRLRNVESVPPHVYSAMAELGDLRNITIASLGQRTSKALGYKLVSDVSELRKSKLEATLGSLVLNGLEGLNLIELTPVMAQDYASWKADVESENPGTQSGSLAGLSDDYIYNFVRIASKDGVPSKGVQKIVDANKKTNNVINKLFEVNSTFTMPLTEAPTNVKSTFNGAGTPIPSEAEETIKVSQVRPYGFITPMVKVTNYLRNLDEIEYKRMLGFKTENELEDMQVMKQKGQRSVNEAIERSLDIFDSFRSDLNNTGLGEQADFFMPQFLVSNTRGHYDSDLNPQMDKIHRGLVGMKEHEVELDVNQELFTNEGITEMGRFIQALAMNMEKAPIYKNPLNGKYVTIDKANYKNFIPAFMAYIETPLVRNAIESMQRVQSGKANHKDMTNIRNAVAEFGMNMQSLQALQALADFDTARGYAAQGSSSKFKTELTFQSDGVTNGPFLTGISTNTLADKARNAGGLFRDEKIMSVPEYKEGLGQDLYEFLGESMKAAWASVKKSVEGGGKKMAIQAMKGLDTLYPAFGERNGAKPITTTSNYGAGDDSIIAANAREVVSSLINKLDTPHIDEAIGAINAANDIIKYIDVIAKFKAKDKGLKHTPIPLIPTNVNPKKIELAPEQIRAIFDHSKRLHGAAIESALIEGMGDFIPVRNTLTNHASLAFEFFDILRTDALEAAQERAIQEKTLETVNGKPIESISVREKNRALREIAKYMPTFPNAMASISKNKAQSSTPLMKTALAWEESYQATSELHFKKGSMKVHSHLLAPANPGVSGLALAIQSMDSFVTHFVMKRMAAQNYHDANASSIKMATKMAQAQNEAVYTALRKMHLSSGMVKAFLRSANGVFDLGSLTTDGELPSSIEKALRKMVGAKKDQDLSDYDFASEIQKQVSAAFDRDIAKLRELAKEKYIGQYGTQDGHYTVTQSDLKDIDKEINKLKADRIRQLEEAGRLGKALNQITGYKPPAKTAVSIDSIMSGGVNYGILKKNLYKELGQYTDASNTQAQQYSVLFRELLKMFDTAVSDELVLKGISINSVEADNIPGIDTIRANKVSAWFGKDAQGKDAIFFAEEAGSPTAKVVVHELLHAATVNAIANLRQNPGKYPEGQAVLERIEKLFNNVKKKVSKDPNASNVVKYGVKNLEEFVATGLTYSEFVDYLAKTQVQSGSRSKLKFTDGFAEFIKSVADVLSTFVKSKVFQSSRMISALEALVYDTTDLIQNTNNLQAELPTNPTQLSIFGAPIQAREAVNGYTAYEVFSTLPKHANPSFQLHLNQMMTQVTDTIYAGLEQHMIDSNGGTWSVEQAWDEYTNAGNAETTETAVTAGFSITEQEAFAIESIYAAMVHGLKDKSMTQVYSEIRKAYDSAKKRLKPESFFDGEWATATRQDKADAQDMYDYFFKLGTTNQQHLARFVSMALGSEQMYNKLGFAVKDTAIEPTNTFELLVEKANTLLDFIGGVLTNSNSAQHINNRVGLLAKELARIDAKNREHAVGRVETQLEHLADYTDGVSKKLRAKVVEFADKDAIANNRYTYVRLASNVTRLAAKGDLWTTLDAIKEINTLSNPNTPLGMFGEAINEAANNDATKNSVEHMLRLTKLNNQMKENIRHTTTNNVMSTFEENGKYLTKEHKHAITTMLRSDVQVLVDTFSTQEIAKLYSDGKFLQNETATLVNQLKVLDPVQAQVMINRAKQLAKYMLTGNSSSGMAKNAQLIVSGFNTGEVVDIGDARVNIVDKLATMYAIEYTNSTIRKNLIDVFKRELKNKTNGMDTSIKFHKEMAKEAREKLFVDNVTSVIKGYMPEITNPNKEVRIATSALDVSILKSQFYREVKTMIKDKTDKTQNVPRLFISDEANVQRLVSGAIEIVSTNRKGTGVIMDAKEFNHAVANISTPTSPLYNPMLDQDVYMTPNYNTQNEIVGFSYEMSGNNRDSLLERNNDFSELLGAYASTNFNKVTVPEQNNKVIDAAYEDYKDNFVNNPRAYITVGPNSEHPGLAETWAMLPESTRRHAIAKFGNDGMVIRNDVLLAMFGYRKYSLNQAFDKMPDARNMFESIYTDLMNTFFGTKARLRGVQGERAWQEAVATMKDIVVIRNVKTIIANTVSNAMLLHAHGITFSDIVRDTSTSIRGGIQYRRDMANLLAIRQKQRAGIGNFNELEQQALRIEDSMQRNPLSSFINEGMMPTIVEDLDPSNNHYSYKSKLQERLDDLTSDVPKSVKTAAKWLMVSPDTPLYQFLNNATQFSDFSSKYVMYKYYTQKAKEKLSHQDALQMASDNFINYDVPTSRGLQYLNDMGIVMFTKYNLRIQKALFQLMKKRPASVMAQALLIGTLTNMETAIDPIVFTQFGNPLRTGAFGLPSALDEPMPIKMLTGMF